MTSRKVVLYTDGGAESPRGMGGSGLFGYTYREHAEAPTGKDQYPTTHGYFTVADKPDDAEWVQPEEYIEGYIAYPMPMTNNVAELMAAMYAMRVIIDNHYDDVVIRPDSNYVLEGYTQYLETWITRGWETANGGPVQNQNLWQRMLEYKRQISELGYDVRWLKVAGHSGEYGNDRADALATLAINQSRLNQSIKHLDIVPAAPICDASNKDIGERHPLLSFPRWYFVNDGPTTTVDPDGGYYYYGGMHGKKVEHLAKPISDSCHVVTRLNTPDPVLEFMRSKQFAVRKLPTPPVVVGNMDNITNSKAYTTMYRGNNLILNTAAGTEDLVMNGKSELTHTLVHPRLAYAIMESLSRADTLLRQVMSDTLPPEYLLTDITDLLFDEQPPKKKIRKKLKPEITVSTKLLLVDLPYRTPTGETASIASRILFGQDCPPRNAFGKLAAFEPKVQLLSWLGDPHTLYFATVVACDTECSIWVGYPANFRLLPVTKAPSSAA